MRSTAVALISGLAALAQAYTTPTTQFADGGNPIFKPSLGEAVPVGKPYAITWNPTTNGTITLLLLRGPSENIKPLYPIVEKTANTGAFQWTPASDLEPDVTHYGLQLIDDATGQYQWSVQFGISNPGYTGASASASGSAGPKSSAPPTGSASASGSTTPSASARVTSSTGLSNSTITGSISRTLSTTATPVSRSATSSQTLATVTASGVAANVKYQVGGVLGFVGGIAMLAL